MNFVRTNLDATFLSGFPAQPWLTDVKLHTPTPSDTQAAAGQIIYNGKALYWYRVNYQVLGTRWKRCIVVVPTMTPPHVNAAGGVVQGTKPLMVVAMPASNNDSDGDGIGWNDGAWDLTQNIGENEVQFQWPLKLVADHNVFATLIDGPLFGSYPYAGPITAIDSLIDDICGVEAGHWFVNNLPVFPIYGVQPPKGKHIFVGGLSWGGIRAEFLIAALRDCIAGYIAGGQMSKSYDTRAMFNPPDWASPSRDYSDMLKAAKAKKVRIMFGGNGNDYLYTPFKPGIDTILSGLVSFDPAKFSTHINASMGHQVDLADLTSFFSSNISTMLYHSPEFEA